MTVEQFLSAWERTPTPSGRHDRARAGLGWKITCPLHDDRHPSLEVSEGADGKLLLKCFGACGQNTPVYQPVLEAVGLWQPTVNGSGASDEIAYPYRDEGGRLLYEVVRFPDKSFRQRRLDARGQPVWGLGETRRVLFGLPELLKTAPGELVAICEGEKDALSVAKAGLTATCNPMGAGKWRQEYTDWLKEHLGDRRFLILPDNDAAGVAHADEVRQSLRQAGLNAQVANLGELPPKGDVSDWLRAGGSLAQLRELAEPEPHPLVTRLLSRDALRNLPPPIWQIEGMFFEQSIVELYGESNHGKSLVGMDIALNVVRGGAWGGRPILKPGAVVYVNADGGPGFSPRLRAWEKANGTNAVFEFWTYPEELLIADPRQMALFTDGLQYLPDAPVMVFIDTLSQCIPGVNENQQDEMSRVVAHLNAVKRRYGCTVVLLHHVGKDGMNRGSTVIPGAADTIIRVTQNPGELIELRCDKQRDGRKFEPVFFSIEHHGMDQGVYLVEAEPPSSQVGSIEREMKEQQVLDILRGNGGWLTREEIRFRTVGMSKSSIYRALKKLVEQQVVAEDERTDERGVATKVYLFVGSE